VFQLYPLCAGARLVRRFVQFLGRSLAIFAAAVRYAMLRLPAGAALVLVLVATAIGGAQPEQPLPGVRRLAVRGPHGR